MKQQAKTGRKVRKSGKPARKFLEDRQAEVADLFERLKAWKAEQSVDVIASYVAKFDGYSENNALLIAMQDPFASDVDARGAWLERGRVPIGQGTGIKITYPAGYATVDDPDHPGQTKRIVTSYGKVYVFDVRRTIENTPEAREAWKADHPEGVW
jgi:hypothetical protein